MSLPLLALSLASFGIGTTEFVIMGLLPEVAADLGVSIPQAGLLVTGYAMGVVIGAPIVTAITNGLPRKATLIGLTTMFIAGNLLCAIAPTYAFLMLARVVTAFCHGAYFGIGAVVAAGLVPKNQRARAMAMMFAGLTIANILGVPAGTALGQAFGWRSTFWAVVAIGCVATGALVLWLPRALPVSRGNLMAEVKVLANARVLLAMAASVAGSASLFSVFTYITPILREVTGISAHAVTWVLVLFGVGITIGNMVGGRLADWRVMTTLIGAFGLLVLVFVAFVFAAPLPVPAAAVVFVWGLLAFAVVPPLQMRVVDSARGAPNLASSLNQGAFNLGNALGAWAGGAALSAGIAYDALPWVGMVLAMVAMAICIGSSALDGRGRPSPAMAAR